MKGLSKTKILYVLFLVYFLVSAYQIVSRSGISATQKSKQVANIETSVEKIKGEITRGFLNESLSATEVIRMTMEFVHNNSIHKVDDWHRKYAFNIPYVLDKMYLTSIGDIDEKPHLTCGPRAYAMREILKKFNLYSRLVQIYSDNFKKHSAHRVLEVYNTDNQSWEVWDPDYGVTYVDRKTKKPVDILKLVFSDKNNFIPIGVAGEGWKITNTELIKDNYFEAVLFEADTGMRNSMIVINQSKFDINKVYDSGKTFKEWAKAYYKNPRFVLMSERGRLGF